MSTAIIGRERRECPSEFQERINDICGLNRFGGPNVKIAWGQTETKIAAGTHGYEERLLCPGAPCWYILRWIAPECFGTPKMFYEMTYNPELGLMENGEYPYEGSYEVLQPLMHRKAEGEQMVIEHLPLCHAIIDLLIPVLIGVRKVSAAEVKAAQETIDQIENAELVDHITDNLLDRMPAFIGPTSYAHGPRNSTFQKKIEDVERAWKQHGKRNWKRGFFQN